MWTRGSTTFVAASVVWIALFMAGFLGPLEQLAPLLLAMAAIVAIVRGIRRQRPLHAWTWWFIAGALTTFVVGDVDRSLLNTLGNLTVTRSIVPDIVTLPAYVLLAIGLFGIGQARAQGRRSDIGMVLDGLLAGLGLLACLSVFLIDPIMAHHHGRPACSWSCRPTRRCRCSSSSSRSTSPSARASAGPRPTGSS